MDQPKGFTYKVAREQLEAYQKWTMERRLKWLLNGNKLRKSLPRKSLMIQEDFRRGKL